MQKTIVDHAVAERKNWAKFGQEKGNKPGPDRATTTVGENIVLRLSAGNKVLVEQLPDFLCFLYADLCYVQSTEPDVTAEQAMKEKLAKAGAGKVLCRLCKGDHFTAKCPYKDSLAGLDSAAGKFIVCHPSLFRYLNIHITDTPPIGDDDYGTKDIAAPAPTNSTGKYVPPSMRSGGATRPGESMSRPGANRDDLPTLRVTNVSEDTTDNDLRELFGVFGRVVRVYIGRDRETGIGKGYAFVSFEERAVAERALQKVNGMGYDNLILNCQWSRKCFFILRSSPAGC